MNRNLIFALFGLVLAGLLTACSGKVPATVVPTQETDPASSGTPPTAVASVPSPTPTLEPTAAPTEAPTALPAEVPLYVGLPLGEVEVYAYAKANCGPVDIGHSDAEVLGYLDELLEQAGFPKESRAKDANLGIYPLDGCWVVYYGPPGGQSVVVFEDVNQEIQVIKTEPFWFDHIVSQ